MEQSVENAEFARSKRGEMNGTRSNLPCACVTGKDAKRASASMTRKVRKRIENNPNPRARRPRAPMGKESARDVTPESEEDEEEGVEWGRLCTGYGCLQTPSECGMRRRHVWRRSGVHNTYRTLLRSQPEDTTRSTREENEINNEKDERGGKPVATQLAPQISTFIRAQWESGELEDDGSPR